MPKAQEKLADLGRQLKSRRPRILEEWRAAVARDPELTTGATLTRAQLSDHIPAILEDFEQALMADDGVDLHEARSEQRKDGGAHGMHRWQQGFDLAEVTRELGRLNECVVAELESVPSHDASWLDALSIARRRWAAHFGIAMSASASQFFELRQIEAAAHIAELDGALKTLKDLEGRRAQLWRNAAHDLRGNLDIVSTVTAGLGSDKASPEIRATFFNLLERNVRSLTQLLEAVTDLARLRGGQEYRIVAPMDASTVLRELCENLQPIAGERGLSLHFDGPDTCLVDGDVVKVRRIAQNLVLNALKYTQVGGVVVSCECVESDGGSRWKFSVADTGPGFDTSQAAPMAAAIGAATEQAHEMAAATRNDPDETNPPRGRIAPIDNHAGRRRATEQSGEGIGLSIVKGLCELLDATLSLESVIDQGTVFTVALPASYPEP